MVTKTVVDETLYNEVTGRYDIVKTHEEQVQGHILVNYEEA